MGLLLDFCNERHHTGVKRGVPLEASSKLKTPAMGSRRLPHNLPKGWIRLSTEDPVLGLASCLG